ncbi:MAG: helix-turn-helix transcriptional regulator [Lentisphaeria bacterium]|jgi:transcriptional regulator with XRE-family HTH domain|nr:helix-turn-helix transcriptional regulator [Lentisphaeria bacterium]
MNLLELSQTIRRLRLERRLTVEQLAQRSGFSKGFISQVENFRISPSLKALNRIAEALEVDLKTLFEAPGKSAEFVFGTVSEGLELQRDDSQEYGMRYLALAGGLSGKKLDPFLVEYHDTLSPRDFMAHETEEFFVLLSGELRFYVYDNNTSQQLSPGGTVYLKAKIPHRAELSPGCSEAKALIVYTEPGE